uniref:Uncharacterized protein n=1 Tax=Trichuris muris TaxID=70415 RepID=A0A5S6QD28_TRIMR
MRPNREVILVLSNLNILLGALSGVVGSIVLLNCKEYKHINCGLLSGLVLFVFGVFGYRKHDGTEQELKNVRNCSCCMIPILLIALLSGSLGVHCERTAKYSNTTNLRVCHAITEVILPMCMVKEKPSNITQAARANLIKIRDTGITMHTFLISCTVIMLACNLCLCIIIPEIIKQEVYEYHPGTAADQHYQFDNNELLENEALARKTDLEKHQLQWSLQENARKQEAD